VAVSYEVIFRSFAIVSFTLSSKQGSGASPSPSMEASFDVRAPNSLECQRLGQTPGVS